MPIAVVTNVDDSNCIFVAPFFFYCDNILFNRKAVLIGNFVEQDHGYTIYVLLAKMEIDLIDGPILITKYSHL
jgi:hypothetical protein